MKAYAEIYAVDFDGTLNTAKKYPELGRPRVELFEFLIERQQAGDKVILWTCREGDLLKSAIKYCGHYGLKFDAVNDNVRENIERWGNNCRKVFADYYIDDKNLMFGGEREEIENITGQAKKMDKRRWTEVGLEMAEHMREIARIAGRSGIDHLSIAVFPGFYSCATFIDGETREHFNVDVFEGGSTRLSKDQETYYTQS